MSNRRPSSVRWRPLKDPGWSPVRAAWQELARLNDDLTWKRADFHASRKDRVPRGETGVYLICARPPLQRTPKPPVYTVLYAGRTTASEGLRSRFLKHIRKPNRKLDVYLRCYVPEVEFWYSVLTEDTKIGTLEVLLIDTFNPPCNSIAAPGSSAIRARIGETVPLDPARRAVSK